MKLLFNYSKISLSATEKSLLVRGLRVSLSAKKINYADYLTNFELFYRSICKIFTKTTLNLRNLIKKTRTLNFQVNHEKRINEM